MPPDSMKARIGEEELERGSSRRITLKGCPDVFADIVDHDVLPLFHSSRVFAVAIPFA